MTTINTTEKPLETSSTPSTETTQEVPLVSKQGDVSCHTPLPAYCTYCRRVCQYHAEYKQALLPSSRLRT